MLVRDIAYNGVVYRPTTQDMCSIGERTTMARNDYEKRGRIPVNTSFNINRKTVNPKTMQRDMTHH